MATAPSSKPLYSMALTGDAFIDWLNKTEPPELRQQPLTGNQIIEAFKIDHHLMLFPEPAAPAPASESPPPPVAFQRNYVHPLNSLYRCQIASLTADGKFLTLPDNEQWDIADNGQSSILARKAYQDHWKIIKHHFVAEKSTAKVIIGGSPGCGKSVEGIFLVYKIFHDFADSPPPILYASSPNNTSALVSFLGYVFLVEDHVKFEDSWGYKLMVANGPVWHIFDSTCPGTKMGTARNGPQIIISSPGRAHAKDLKAIRKNPSLLLYLPLPSVTEMHSIRDHLYNDERMAKRFLSSGKMLSLVDKFGCIPRTIFDFGNSPIELRDIEAKLENATDVERLLSMVGSSVIDHDIVSGSFVHVVPYHRIGISNEQEEGANDLDEFAFAMTERASAAAALRRRKGKRTATEAEMAEIGLSEDQNISYLRDQYTTIVYTWASDYIRDKAFQTFVILSADRMMTIILRSQTTSLGEFRGLLLEPFVHKLLNETGVVGRLRNLETNKELGTKKLGPWKTKNVYRSHSEFITTADVYNIPHKSNEAAIDSIVPFAGFCFQVTVSESHGIHRPGLQELMDTRVFDDFKQRKPKQPVKFIWMIEQSQYESFKKQNFHNAKKEVYAKNFPLRTRFEEVEQIAFEIDMRRVYEFHHAQKKKKRIDMTSKFKKKVEAL
jgi:hypothetical protein